MSKLIHIPIEKCLRVHGGDVALCNRWWVEYKEGHLTISIRPNGEYDMMCNKDENIATKNGTRKAVFIPVVYIGQDAVDEAIHLSNTKLSV